MASSYAARLAELEAEYERLYDQIERQHGGVDYKGQLAALRSQIKSVKKNVEKFNKMRRAVESSDIRVAAKAVVEVLLDTEDTDAPDEIAANFIEDEVGRFDWMTNWEVIKGREDPVAKVQEYLQRYAIQADPQEIVNIIDQMVSKTPGRWK